MDYQTALAAVHALPIEEQARLVAEVQDQRNPQKGRLWEEVYEDLMKRYGQ